MKVAIIGRGAIGLTCAYTLARQDNLELTVYGSRANEFTASRAAGAMLNIVSEVDYFNCGSDLVNWKLRNKKLLLGLWKNIDISLKSDGLISTSLLYGVGTEILVDPGSTNEVENLSYTAMRSAFLSEQEANGHHDDSSQGFLIHDEPSVDSSAYLDALERFVATFLCTVDEDVDIVYKDGSDWIVKDSLGRRRSFDQILLCAGSWSETILKRSCMDIANLRKSYFGVGSALLLRSELDYVASPILDRIFRTPNRGGTCGIHSVQRSDCLYIGASSVVTDVPLRHPRASSAQTLLEGAAKLLNIDCSQLSVEIVTGYRPVTDDAVPNIGELARGLFCCYGTKRDGFTWAPLFAKSIALSIIEPSSVENEWLELLNMCDPHRPMTSAGDTNECIANYVTNKIYEAHQHCKSLSDEQIRVLKDVAISAHVRVREQYGYEVGLQPELINMIYYSSAR